MSSAFENTIFDDPILNVIHLLNSIAQENPKAISLASGRPDDQQCDLSLIDRGLARYKHHVAGTEQSLATLLCQYGKTSGIINEIIATHLQMDEGITVSNPESIVVCLGFQEACTLTLLSIFEGGGVLLVPDPVFSGVTGIAKLLGIKIVPVPMAAFLDPIALRKIIEELESRGGKNQSTLCHSGLQQSDRRQPFLSRQDSHAFLGQ
ncbi:aminotransferase class I/II-fold pyridoxal phosphate-dependent enzyme [Pseudomonas sp. H3_H08]